MVLMPCIQMIETISATTLTTVAPKIHHGMLVRYANPCSQWSATYQASGIAISIEATNTSMNSCTRTESAMAEAIGD